MSSLHLAPAFAALADAALKGTVILLGAQLATRQMRRRSAAARHLVWMTALASMLALPLMTRLLPSWRVVPVPAPLRPAAEFVAEPELLAAPPVSAPAANPAATSSAAAGASQAAPVGKASAPASRVDTAPAPAAFDWKTALLALWAAGGVLLALRLAYGMARVWWMQRRAIEIEDEEWVHITDRLARKLRVGRLVTLLREAHAVVPMTWGIVRPVVLLPSDAEEWDTERRTVVLAHELAHVRRWDTLTQWIAHLALALFWFHPLVWVAARRMREEREHACDDAVLSIGTRPVAYADHLLDIVRSLGQSEGPAAALAMARRSQFEGRLLAILDNATARGGVTRGLGIAALFVAAAAVVPLAALRPAAAAPAPARTAAEAPRKSAVEKALGISLQQPAERLAGMVRKLTDAPVQPAPRDPALGTPAAPRVETPAAPAPQSASPAAQAPAPAVAAPVTTITAPPVVPATKQGLLSRLEGQQDPGLYAAIIRAADEIQSSTDRRLVFTALLEKPDLSADNVDAIVRSARTMQSDTDKRLVLDGAMHHRAFRSNPVPHAFFEALASFGSSTDERLVMEGLLEKFRLNPDCLQLLFAELPRIGSDTDRRLVMVTAARTQPLTPEIRNLFVAATRSIKSDTDRRLALDALMGESPRGQTSGSISPSGRERTWGTETEMEVNGRAVTISARDVVYGRGKWNVLRILPGGRLVIMDARGEHVRRLSAVPGADGAPVWTYTVDGAAHAFDAPARRWFESVIRDFTTG